MQRALSAGLVAGGAIRRIACCRPLPAAAADIKIGTIYDYTGPFAAGGSKPAAIGNKIAIDMINEKGGVEGHKIVAIEADAQSKTDVAINEAERLLNDAKVDLLMGVYSSAHCVPMAAKVDAAKKFMWANVCVASAVFKDKNLKYVFRPQVHSDQFGEASCSFIAENAKTKLGKEVKDIKVAIIHEDGPYGVGVAMGNEAKCKELGMQIVHKEGYSATVRRPLRPRHQAAARPARHHPAHRLQPRHHPVPAPVQGSRPEIHGADRPRRRLRPDRQADRDLQGRRQLFLQRRPGGGAAARSQDRCKPGLGDLTAEMVKRYKAATGAQEVPPHVSMGFNQAWIFLTDVLPRAIKKHGGYDPEALRKAALETDIPDGGTIQGYGVKFFPPGHKMAGQNERSSPVVMQYVEGVTKIAWPTAIKTADPVLPLPKGHAYAR